jgi:hypothetical protein
MNQALLNSLTEPERSFVAETSAEALAVLDEDAVLDLHARARRMRDKYVKNYRRAAGAQVSTVGGRGLSYGKNQRARGKAEVFESALARVSRRLGALAAQSAEVLRRERIEAARSRPLAAPTGPTPARSASAGTPGRPRTAKKTSGARKRDASSRAMGARRQAKRDAR